MATRYLCTDTGRRLASVQADPTLNGIDVLEVLDDDAPDGIEPQRSLLVRCVKPVPDDLNRNNVRIEGGVRRDPKVNPVEVVWAYKATVVAGATAASITDADKAFFPTLTDAENVLVVRTSSSGDFSSYVLAFTRSRTSSQPPDGFDPELSEVSFTFKVDCPSEFDCAKEVDCPLEPLPEPRIDYLAKDYASFRQLMIDRLALIMPGWVERNPSDVNMALIETLAYAADQLSYYQDAVATEAYLGTARRRTSMRRHARLLDYFMHDGSNARAWISLEVGAGGGADGAVVLAGTQVLTRGPDPEATTLSPDRVAESMLESPVVFQTLHDLELKSARNSIQFYTWGDKECCLPKGATSATLRGSLADLRLKKGDALILEETVGPSPNYLPEDADPARRHVVRLNADPVGATDPLTGDNVQAVAWFVEDALPFPMCLTELTDGGLAAVARGNVVLADHGRLLALEELDPVPEQSPFRLNLKEIGLTQHAPYVDDKARKLPATSALVIDMRTVMPDIKLALDRDEWIPQRDLISSSRFALEFVVEMETDGRASLRFGDNVLGRRPAPTSQFLAKYRVGSGSEGNVGPEALARVVTDLPGNTGGAKPGITRVRNPMAAAGGTDPEPIEQVRQYAPQAFRIQERAVTEEDYASVAARNSEVQRAAATRRWTGSWYTAFVSVDRKGGYAVDESFREGMSEFLERYRMAGYDVEVEEPVFVPLEVVFTVCVDPGYFRSNVKQALLETFSTGTLSDGHRGFFHPDNFTFGQPVYLSRMVAEAMRVAGVSWIDTDDTAGKPNLFRRWGQNSQGERAAGLIRISPLEVARLDNDPSAPENGKIDFVMEGGL
jgi:hypothetical protein